MLQICSRVRPLHLPQSSSLFLISTSERASDRPTLVRLHNKLDGHIRPCNTDERASQKRSHVQEGHHRSLDPSLESTFVVIRVVQPERTRDTVGVPGREERRRNADEIGEDGHADSENERSTVHDDDQDRPRAPSDHGMLMQMPRVAKHSDEEQLCRGVRVQTASDQEVRQRNPVRRFRPLGRQAREGRTVYLGPEVDVHDHRKNNVKCCSERLKGPRGFHGILWPTHLGDQDKKHKVPCVGEDGIRNRYKGFEEAGRHRCCNFPVSCWEGTSDRHTDHACN